MLKVTMWMSPSSLKVIHAWGHSVLKVAVLPGCRDRCVLHLLLGWLLAGGDSGDFVGLSQTKPEYSPAGPRLGWRALSTGKGAMLRGSSTPEGVLHLDMGIRGGPGSASGLNLCVFEGASRNGGPPVGCP